MQKYKVKIKKIVPIGKCKAYDLHVNSNTHSYVANGFITHNSLHSGQASIYADRKQKNLPNEYLHPLLEPITKDTRGIILYQEQVMLIMYNVGKMSWATAESARKIMTKSKGKDAFNKVRKEFVENANKINHMPREEAEKLYDVVSTFGSYSFNKSHALEYSIITYYCAWLKTYYPKFFYKSLLKFEKDSKAIQDIISEAEKNNVKLNFPDINKSKADYNIYDDEIYAGFSSIKGIGKRTSDKIIKHQPFTSFDDFVSKVKPSKNILKGLIIADCFRDFNKNKKFLFTQKETEDYDSIEYNKLLLELTDLKPKEKISDIFNFGNFPFLNIGDIAEKNHKKEVFMRGLITDRISKDKLIRPNFKDHVHSFQKKMLYLNLNDGTGNIALQIGPATYELFENILTDIKGSPVVAYGTLNSDGKKLFCDMLQVVGKTDFINNISKNKNKKIIVSAQPEVSKSGNSYYRIRLNNGVKGLYFKPEKKIFPGMEVEYKIYKEPFINLRFIAKKSIS